jgi:hypothetical protein
MSFSAVPYPAIGALIHRRVEQPDTESGFSMQAEAFLLVVATGIIVILVSMLLDFLWAQMLPRNVFIYLIRAPGVMVHECSHILGCLVTGADIRKIVLFSRGGGSVTYAKPAIPLLGNVIISTAPLFCIPLVLAGCTWIFSQYLGCVFPPLPMVIDSPEGVLTLGGGIAGLFIQNIFVKFNPWFFLYLYLTLTLVLSLAPSHQDLKNAVTGMILLMIAGVLIFWSSIPWAVTILWDIARFIGMGFALGLGCDLVALVISVPVIIGYLHKRYG